MKLEKENAIITGGTLGLGLAIVREFLNEGANVLFCARDKDAVSGLQDELTPLLRTGQKLLGLYCDVSSPREVENMFAQFVNEFGALHVLVNNAGVYGPKGPSEDV